jgi:hypothetical protein
MAYSNMKEVTFITPNGEMMIRMMNNHANDICNAAEVLKAPYVVVADDWDVANDRPIIGLFDMSKAQKDTPTPGHWSWPNALKTFPNVDAAVMYAQHVKGR